MNEKWSFNFGAESDQKISAKNLYCAGGGRWVVGGGWTVEKKVLHFFFVFKYINKKNVLIPNMVLKVVYGFYIRSYKHFKFQLKIKRNF